jgi:hypothetical protein
MKSNGVPKIEYSGKEPSSTRPNYKKKDRIVDPGFPVDPMGYWNPANVGKIVQVPTENGHITMRGVDQPLIGMDEHGNTQYQMPGMEYHYPGNFITEYPITKNGGWLDIAQDGKEVKLKNIKQLYNPLNERYTKLLEDPEAYKKNGEKNLLFLADWLMRVNDTEDLTERNPHPYTQQIKDMQLKLISTPNDELSNFIQNADLNQKGLGQLKNLPYIPKSWNKSDVFKYMNYFKQNKDKGYTYQDGGWLDTMQEGGSKNPEWYNGKLATGSKYPLPPADKRRIPQSGMVVDKRTNQAYYFGYKGETGNFPVLTGKNPDGNINTYSLSDLKENSKLRNTPTGYYTINKESTYKSPDMLQHYAGMMRDVEPIPAFGVPAPKSKDLGFHLTYMDPFNPAVYKNRDSLYRGKEYDRNASYGCVNCEKESYEAFNKAVPKTDTMMVLDSKNYADRILLEQAKSRMKTKPLMEDGGWLDEVEEFRRGGQKGLKKFTSKNIQSSVNDIMMRNVTLFGPAGKKRYKPGLKFEEGGESNEMQYGGSSVVDYLISKGQDYSKQHRAQLAKEYGVSDYDFTAEKNLELLDKLKNSKPVSQKPITKTQAQSYLMKPIEKENSRGTDRTGQTKKVNVPTKEQIAYAKLPKEVKLQIAAQQQAQANPDQLRENIPQGKMSKAWDVVSHPMTALRELNKYGYIPDNLSQHPDKNPLDMAFDVINPAFYANAAGRLAKASVNPNTYFDLAKTAGYLTTSLAGDQAPEGYEKSAMNTAGVAGDAGALLGLGQMSKALKAERIAMRDAEFANTMTIGKGVDKVTVNNSKEFFDHFNNEAAITGKTRTLKKKEIDFLNKEIKQRGILEIDRKHPLDPRSIISKSTIIPEDYNFKTVLNPKNIATNLYKSVTEGSPESLYTMGHGRVAGWNQYLGLPTKNNPYRVHPESFTEGQGMFYTIPDNEITKLHKQNLRSNNSSAMLESQQTPAQGIKELSFYKESLNPSKEFNQKAYEKVYDDMLNASNPKTGDFLYSNEKEIKKVLGPKGKFEYNLDKHKELVPDGDIPDWITQQEDLYRTGDWDKYVGSHGGVGWKVKKLPNSKYEKWSMEDVWDINPLSRMKNLPKPIRDFDAGKILGGKNYKVQLDYFSKPGGKDIIPAIPKKYGGESQGWLDNIV